MGTWEMGPFSNDDAADLLGCLDDAEPAAALALLREALTAADTDEYLQVDVGQVAVAVSDAAYRSGRWQRVGSVPLLAADVPIPEFFLQDILDPQQCEVIDHLGRSRTATPQECVGLERAAVWAAEHIEERVRDHYQNRPNAHLAYMKLRR